MITVENVPNTSPVWSEFRPSPTRNWRKWISPKFQQLHDYLRESYPLIHQKLKLEIIGRAGLLYSWKGTGKSDQLPLVLIAHQDVVPEGDLSLWKYPPYEGVVAEGKLWAAVLPTANAI